jgi:dCMP deaminase
MSKVLMGGIDVRPSWDDYFINIVEDISKRSTCLRRKVGALIVKDNRILATGYNGAPIGCKHCLDIGCLRQELNIPSGQRHELCRALHAEQNAFLQAAKYGVAIEGATLYVTTHPCSICAKMAINAGITKIVYIGEYPDELSEKLLEEANILVVQLRR